VVLNIQGFDTRVLIPSNFMWLFDCAASLFFAQGLICTSPLLLLPRELIASFSSFCQPISTQINLAALSISSDYSSFVSGGFVKSGFVMFMSL
jgi:hypothetical protein